MESFLVRADHQVHGPGGGGVDHQTDLARNFCDTDRGCVSGDCAAGTDEVVVGELDGIEPEDVFEFAFVDLEISADEDEDQFLAILGTVEHRLAGLGGRHVQEIRDFLDGLRMRGGDFFKGKLFAGAFELQAGYRDLAVRLVAPAVGRQEDVVLSAVRQEHEFVRHAAAHHAGVGQNGDDVLHTDAAENAFVSGMKFLIIGIQILLRSMKTVSILHRELADTDQTGARTGFVAVLGLDLVDHHGQLLVAVDLGAGDLAAGFLVRHAQDHSLVVAVCKSEELCADGLVTSGLHPEVGGQHDRHQDFLAADAVHFLTDDGFDLGDDALSDRQQGVDAGGNGTDISPADQKFMTGGGGFRRILFQAIAEQMGNFHGKYLADCVIIN